ncbi:hypothetical protein LY78DRAFT_446673 [Colletotrichum sublineola]|nr:hypothetical protein LY78DRAFT_446673 [Colletotrichum sublineola]
MSRTSDPMPGHNYFATHWRVAASRRHFCVEPCLKKLSSPWKHSDVLFAKLGLLRDHGCVWGAHTHETIFATTSTFTYHRAHRLKR